MAGSAKSPHLKLLDRLAAEIRRTLKSPARDPVHDLRVAARRFGQLLAVLETAGASGIGKMRRDVKELIRLAGGVRDYDIAAKLVAKFHPSKRLQSRLKRRRTEAERELLAGLRAWTSSELSESRQAIASFDEATLDAATRHTLQRKAQRLLERAKTNGSPRALHKLRIAAKKLRYTMELAPFPPSRLASVKALQTKLGDINDYESSRQIAAKEGASKTLVHSLEEAQEKKTKRFRRYWKREFAGKEKGWLAILTDPPRSR